ncbi:MAG: sulfatase-like hydrolase/transferase [Lachnospiraceae bacterium]|nr:sulfatase-like hydrolase/transferase [Lachnospiraceae bacterium]
MDTQDSFFKDVTALGDILHQNGYNQEILLGSDSEFGGRKLYFEEHGDYEVKDLIYAKEAGWLPEDYYVFWGFEDEKLFEYAKNEMLELSSRNEPFNLSLLTVDTHFEDGYVCHLCDDEFGDNQYANVMACSSRQVSQLVEWIKQQDFYANTTIILSGDHTTMDSDFCAGVDEDYGRRTFTAVINPASEPEEPGKERIYTTLDLFPTTLGALGAKIEGNRLGIGTNLFSSVPTLAEEYTLETMKEELDKRSRFMSELSDMDLGKAELYDRDAPEGRIVLKNIDEAKDQIEIDVMNFDNLDEEFEAAYIEIKNIDGGEMMHNGELAVDGMGNSSHLTGNLDTSGIELENAYLSVSATGKSGIEYPEVAVIKGNLYMYNWEHYMDYLAERLATGDYTLFISAKEEASGAVDDAVLADLQRLGIKTDLRDKWRESYYAVITPEGVAEDVSKNRLEYDGTLPDGSAFKVISEGYDSGRFSSIMLEDGEHSINKRGLNFVLFNSKTGEIEDSVNFDTNDGLGASREPHRNGQV